MKTIKVTDDEYEMIMNFRKLMKIPISQLIKLLTEATIFSVIKVGDSLSTLEYKTGLSPYTVSQAVNRLEDYNLLHTKRESTSTGRARVVSWYNQDFCKYSKNFLEIVNRLDQIKKRKKLFSG